MLDQRSVQACSIQVENVWGPQVQGCGTDFDLTLLFQEAILCIVPLGIAIVLAVWRIVQLARREAVVASPLLHGVKLVSPSTHYLDDLFCGHCADREPQGNYVVWASLEIALLLTHVFLWTSRTRTTIATSCLSIIGVLVFSLTSHYEHTRSVRASTLMILYLSYSILADVVRARTQWSMPRDNFPIAAIFTTCCVCKVVLLVLEYKVKTVRAGVRKPTPDEQANIVSQAFLWWLLPLFKLGKKMPRLTSEMLPDVDSTLTGPCKVVGAEKEGEMSRPSIFHHLFATRRSLLIGPIFPRLAYTGFMYAQPFLVERATTYMSEPSGPNTYRIGSGLIAAYVIVYVGIAVSNSLLHKSYVMSLTMIMYI